jgi:hypothetical protein|nr:hypothetical protein [Kofleriaceae bacterium]
MRIRAWNAYASNNSGSYLIVGAFREAAVAAEVARELADVAARHTAWLDALKTPGPSPLADLARSLGVPHDPDTDDVWPDDEVPAVWASGHQLFVHVDETISMPRLFGHAIYARGGRVQTELDHAHGPIVVRFEVWFSWQKRSELDIPALVRDIVDDLARPGGVVDLASPHITPAWRFAGERAPFGEPDLEIGAAFPDLAAGFAAVYAAATAHGAGVRVRVSEHHGHGDPFAELRPSLPAPRVELVDLWLDDVGLAPTEIVRATSRIAGLPYARARALIDRAPVVLRRTISRARGEALQRELAAGHAVTSLRVVAP